MTDKFVKKSADMSGLRELIAEIQAGKFRLQRLWEIGVRPIFRLHPPRGGFRKSSKRPFADGGELGYRRDGLTDLLAKMC
jgi:large subunit ribosomal protein L30